MQIIDQLNERLGSELGRTAENPRFAWKYAPDIHYYTRDETAVEFTRNSWAGRLGQVWVLCQFLLPTSYDPSNGRTSIITPDQWWESFHGAFPYPKGGMYYAHPETALAVGRIPDLDETLILIASIRRQLEMSYEEHLKECTEAAEKQDLDFKKERLAEAEEWFPYGWKGGQAHEPGTRGAHISFGGTDCKFDESKGLYLP